MTNKSAEKCIRILQAAKTDNEQFAGLLLVAKVIKAEECDQETLQKVFEAIGFSFLIRLLRTSQVPEGCSVSAYRSLAVTVLSCFLQHPHLATHPSIVSCMPYFNDIITEDRKDAEQNSEQLDTDEEQLISDCYDCLSCVALQTVGRAMLIKEQCVAALCVAVHKQCPCWKRAEALLLHLVSECGNKTWQGNEHGLQVLLSSLCQRFLENQGQEKFELCKTIGTILSSVEKEQLKGESEWTSALYKGLTDIFRSKLGSHQRNPALLLASAAVDLLGVTWIMSPDGRTTESEAANCRFFLLLVHLICIEVRMNLEDKDIDQVLEMGEVLVACYRLLETIISYLATGPSLALDGRQVGQLHAAMVGAFNAVLLFLTRVSQQDPKQSHRSLVIASIRVLGSWVAEETTALQQEVQDLLPFIISVCSEDLDLRLQALTPDNTRSIEASLSGLKVTDKSATDANDNTSGPGAGCPPSTVDDAAPSSLGGGGGGLPEVIRFLLPGLCHLSADDRARQVLMEAGGSRLLVHYFDYQWRFFASQGNTLDSQMALTTLCGVMLNIVVLEGARLAEMDVGRAFLRCAIRGLPFVEHRDDNLVIALNLTVLGLMMLRHHKGDEDQARCEGFCKSAISLLSRAHCRRRADGGGWTVQVTESFAHHWPDCAELWFLAMQALAEDVALYPWLPRIVLGSGFIPIILRLLKDVKGAMGKEAMDAYQAVLVAMTKNDKTAKQLLREQQAQQLARTHKMDELGRALAS